MTQRVAFSPTQASAETGISVDRLVADAMTGRLRAHRVDDHVIITCEDLQRYVANLPRAAAQSSAQSSQSIAAGLARGRAIVESVQQRTTDPKHERGRQQAERLLGKART